MAIDFSKETKMVISNEEVRQIANLAARQLTIQKAKDELEEKLKEVTEQLRTVQEIDLPDAMLAVGLSEFKLSTGESVTITKGINPSIPAKSKSQAYTWLRENKHSSIIKNTVSVVFGRDQDDDALTLITELKENGYTPEAKHSIHYQTLKKFVGEYIADPDNDPLPEEFFTVYETKKAVIKLS